MCVTYLRDVTCEFLNFVLCLFVPFTSLILSLQCLYSFFWFSKKVVSSFFCWATICCWILLSSDATDFICEETFKYQKICLDEHCERNHSVVSTSFISNTCCGGLYLFVRLGSVPFGQSFQLNVSVVRLCL